MIRKFFIHYLLIQLMAFLVAIASSMVLGILVSLIISSSFLNNGFPLYLEWLYHYTLGNASYFFPFSSILGVMFFWSKNNQNKQLAFYLTQGGNIPFLKKMIAGIFLILQIMNIFAHFSFNAHERKMADITLEDKIQELFRIPSAQMLISQSPVQYAPNNYFVFTNSQSDIDSNNKNRLIMHGILLFDFTNTLKTVAAPVGFIDKGRLTLLRAEVTENKMGATTKYVETYTTAGNLFQKIAQAIQKTQFTKIESMDFNELFYMLQLNQNFEYSKSRLYAYLTFIFMSLFLIPVFYIFYFALEKNKRRLL